jgi:hypothetical protein
VRELSHVLSICLYVHFYLSMVKLSSPFTFNIEDMKKKKVPFALYDHNEVVAVGRNLSLSESGRRRTTTTSHIDVPAIRVADLPLHLPFEPGENESYAYDDDHIPLQPETDNGTGVKVKVTERAKRYQNSVSCITCTINRFPTNFYRTSL